VYLIQLCVILFVNDLQTVLGVLDTIVKQYHTQLYQVHLSPSVSH
jgi:hypothetical protein